MISTPTGRILVYMTNYSELYDYDEYKTYIKAKANCFPKKGWRKHLEEGSKHKAIFLNLLRQLVSKEEADNFMTGLYETLKRKLFPFSNNNRAKHSNCQFEERNHYMQH